MSEMWIRFRRSTKKVREDSVIVRVDNRWIQGNRRDGQYHRPTLKETVFFRMNAEGATIEYSRAVEHLQPYYVGHFKLNDRKLNAYLTGCLQSLSSDTADSAIEKIYPWPVEQAYHSAGCANQRGVCAQRWPSQSRQQDGMGNCTLSSHNYGVVSRLGPNLSLWLFDKELSIVVQQGLAARQGSQRNEAPAAHSGMILRGATLDQADAEKTPSSARYTLPSSSGFFSSSSGQSSQSSSLATKENSSAPSHGELILNK